MSDSPTPRASNPSWDRVQLARHPKRPHSLDYIQRLFTDFREIHGDRFFGDEERGQAEAIAYNLREMSRLSVPVIIVVIGEGGSGGALGVAVGNRIYMLQNSWYSVISPESCAAI